MQAKNKADFWHPERYDYYPEYYDDRILYESPALSNEMLKGLPEDIDKRREALMSQCQDDEQRIAVSDWAQDCHTMHIALVIYRNNASFAHISRDERAFVHYRNAYEQAIGIFLPFFEQTLDTIVAGGKAVATTAEKVAQPLPQHLSELMEADKWQRVQEVLKEEGLLSAEGAFVKSRTFNYMEFIALLQELMDKQPYWMQLSGKEQFQILQNTFGYIGVGRNMYKHAKSNQTQQKFRFNLLKRIKG